MLKSSIDKFCNLQVTAVERHRNFLKSVNICLWIVSPWPQTTDGWRLTCFLELFCIWILGLGENRHSSTSCTIYKNRFQQNRKRRLYFILILFWKKSLSILIILWIPHIRYVALSTEFLHDKTNGSDITILLWCFQQGIVISRSFLRVKRKTQHDF